MKISEIVSRILTLYTSGQGNHRNDIASFIESSLKDDPHRFEVLEQLRSLFDMEPESDIVYDVKSKFSNDVSQQDHPIQVVDKQTAELEDVTGEPNIQEAFGSDKVYHENRDIFKLLLGRDVSGSGLSEQEMMDRMAECMDAIFSQLNEILSAIKSPLADTGDVTIRYVIKEHLIEGNDLNAVKDQIHQIKKAYLLMQESFQAASRSVVEKLMMELNPDAMLDEQESVFKPGFIKNADGFKIFQVKYERCMKWFESNRFNHDLLNAFEKEYSNKLKK